MNDLQQKAEQALNDLFDACNKMGGEDDVQRALEGVLARQHRTLQQNFMRQIILPSIKIYAEKGDSRWYDERNEASCKLALHLYPHIKDSHLPFI